MSDAGCLTVVGELAEEFATAVGVADFGAAVYMAVTDECGACFAFSFETAYPCVPGGSVCDDHAKFLSAYRGSVLRRANKVDTDAVVFLPELGCVFDGEASWAFASGFWIGSFPRKFRDVFDSSFGDFADCAAMLAGRDADARLSMQ